MKNVLIIFHYAVLFHVIFAFVKNALSQVGNSLLISVIIKSVVDVQSAVDFQNVAKKIMNATDV